MKMKKISVITALAAVLLIFGVTVIFATTATDKKTQTIGVVNTDALKIRSEASSNAEVLSLLPQMQTVVILSEENGFYHVSIPSDEETLETLEGWVKMEYVNIN